MSTWNYLNVNQELTHVDLKLSQGQTEIIRMSTWIYLNDNMKLSQRQPGIYSMST